jgi:Protein of unknown function (DUF2975)
LEIDMQTFRDKVRDPLLLAASILLWVMFAMLVIGAVATSVGALAIWFYQPDVLAEIAKSAGGKADPEAIGALSLLMGIAAIACGLGCAFVLQWLKVIGSVATGDPFTEDNARRLQRMGWIGVVLHVVGALLAGILDWAGEFIAELETKGDVELSSVILILMLFILARVFRLGAQMRSDLEGTV